MSNNTCILIKYTGRVLFNARIQLYPHQICTYGTHYCACQYYYKCTTCNAYYCINHYMIHSGQTANGIVHYWTNNILTILDTHTHTKKNLVFNIYPNFYSESISVGERIYIMGGGNPLLDTVYEANLQCKQLIERQHMPCKLFDQALCHSSSYIYTVGGWNGISLSDCGKYDIIMDHWYVLPHLNVARHFCAAFVWKCSIYALCGLSHEVGMLDSMEKLNALDNTKWDIITMANHLTSRYCMHGISISNGVIVFGGLCNLYVHNIGWNATC